MRLHTYFRSSTSHRVRIVLNLKGIEAEQVHVNLRDDGHRADAYRALNPQGLVPALEDGGAVLTQSLAIVEYLDETHPEPPLMPPDAAGRARVRALMGVCACDMHPLNNLRVLRHLRHELGQDQAAVEAWCRHWMVEGLDALEPLLAGAGRFSHGDAPTLADASLVAQTTSARRWLKDLDPWPTVARIEAACLEMAAFRDAMPVLQGDAV